MAGKDRSVVDTVVDALARQESELTPHCKIDPQERSGVSFV